jgi:hypothetical protein
MSDAESRFRALAEPRTLTYHPLALQRGETMELLHLEPPDYAVHSTGIYVIDDDGISILAGPFESETAAIRWIDLRQEILIPSHPVHASAAS